MYISSLRREYHALDSIRDEDCDYESKKKTNILLAGTERKSSW